MPVVIRELKYLKMIWNEKSKVFVIISFNKTEDYNRGAETGRIVLSKASLFSVIRFAVSMAQRNWLRKKQ